MLDSQSPTPNSAFSSCFFRFALIALILVFSVIWSCKPGVKPGPGFLPLKDTEAQVLIQSLDPELQGLDSWQDLEAPLQRSLAYLQSRPATQPAIRAYGLEVTWQQLGKTLKDLLLLLPELDQEPGLLSRTFQWYELRPDSLLTGYYEPLLEASLEKDPEYPYPIYGLPPDLKTADLGQFHPRWRGQKLIYRIENDRIQPYPDRRSIESEKALQAKGPIIAWAKDLVDVFFLQIQGSGRLLLPDGSIQPLGYAGKNGRRYVSLGRQMAEAGHFEPGQLSMGSIREHLGNNPDLLPEILYTNPSYVFFQLRSGGPYGAMGQELTPLVSLAVDPDLLALGSLLAIQADLPDPEQAGHIDFFGLGQAQDIGGAIQGHHLDLFCGFGPLAGALAGGLKQEARVFLLLTKEQ